MREVEPQSTQRQQQPTVAEQGSGTAVASPQGEQIAQLEAMVDSSPQSEKQRSMTMLIDDSPAMTAQRQHCDMIKNSTRQVAQQKNFNNLFAAQRIEDDQALQFGLAPSTSVQLKKPEAKPNNTGLPDNLKTGIENISGMSMDGVKVHYNSSQAAQLNALAYAQGTDIHVAPGQEQHLPHEAWHIVQQMQGRVRPTMQMKNGVPVNDDASLEREADVMGAKALQMCGSDCPEKVSTSSIPSTDGSVLPAQRKFGFEIEIGVALGWSDAPETDQDGSKYGSPDSHVTMPTAAQGDGFEVHIDHNADINAVRNSTSIVELVTTPALDEASVGEDEVKGHIKKFTDFVTSVGTKTSGLSGRAQLANITNVTATKEMDGTLFVGGEGKNGQQLETGYMQSTFAVSLAAVPKVMRQYANPVLNVSASSRNALDLAGEKTKDVDLEFLLETGIWRLGWKKTKKEPEPSGNEESPKEIAPTDKYTSQWGTEFSTIKEAFNDTKEGLQPLMGLLCLMLNYLRAGALIQRHSQNTLRKNHLGLFFYKTGLHNVRNTLTGASRVAVESEEIRSQLSNWLAVRSGRSGELFCDVQKSFEPDDPRARVLSDTTVDEWITRILEGTSDTIFTASLNEYSKELAPEDVGKIESRTKGVVMESRRMAPSGGYTYTNSENPVSRDFGVEPDQSQNHRDINDWEGIALGLWRYLRKVNGIDMD